MAAYRRVYDSHHLQADYQEPKSAPEPYARKSSMGYLFSSTEQYKVKTRTNLTKPNRLHVNLRHFYTHAISETTGPKLNLSDLARLYRLPFSITLYYFMLLTLLC